MKRINFLGIPVNVADEEDIAKAAAAGQMHYYIVIRTSDAHPEAHSPELAKRRTRTLCEVCSALCYMDPKSFDSLRGLTTMIICAQCMVDKHKEEKQADA